MIERRNPDTGHLVLTGSGPFYASLINDPTNPAQENNPAFF